MANSKSYFNISELAKELDVKKSHIRFCEEKGLISPRITMMKRRIYSRHDRARLKLILHCVLIGYSQNQIVELIGTPDVNLDEIEQIRKSLEYGEKKLDELVKLSRELKFHQRTGVRAEVNMMHEYVEELKTMKPTVVDEPTAEPYILDEDREETAPKPAKSIKPEIEKKPARQPARMVPVYVVGLALVFIIAGFFYYQSSKKETKTLSLAHKEPIKTETHSVYHSIVPSDNTDDQKTLPLQPPVASASVPKDVPAAPAKEEVVSVPEKKVSKSQVKEGGVTEKPVVEKPTVVPDSVKVLAAAPAVEKEKAPKAEVAKEQEPPPPVAEAPVPEKAPAAPEKEEPASVPDLQASEAEVKEGPAIEESDIEAQPVETNTDKLLAARPEVDSPGITEESTPAIEAEDKEILASKGETLAQQDQEERLKSFLRTYCRTYESKDINKFAAFFAPDAVENDTPFQDMLPKYRKNMEKIESFSYRIELVAYSLQTDTGNVKIQGDYFTRYLLHKGTWKEGSGSISMELTNSGDSYLVKQLNYGK